MNNAKNLYDTTANILYVECERSKESGVITKQRAVVKHGSDVVCSKLVDYDYDINLLDGYYKQKQESFLGELVCTECYKRDYDPQVDFMFYTSNGVVLLDKKLNLVYHSPTGQMFQNKKDLLKLICLYGPCAMIYMEPKDYLDKNLQKQIKRAFNERLKNLKKQGYSQNDLNFEISQYNCVVATIEQQAQKENGYSY